MAQFMLLLHNPPDAFAAYTPERLQAIFVRYRSWRQELMEAGKLAGGAKLVADGGRNVVPTQGGRTEVTDGPYAEAKEVLGGYFTVSAADYEEAVEIARRSPHLDYGWIQIRQVDPV
jgi:hypothetical protein